MLTSFNGIGNIKLISENNYLIFHSNICAGQIRHEILHAVTQSGPALGIAYM